MKRSSTRPPSTNSHNQREEQNQREQETNQRSQREQVPTQRSQRDREPNQRLRHQATRDNHEQQQGFNQNDEGNQHSSSRENQQLRQRQRHHHRGQHDGEQSRFQDEEDPEQVLKVPVWQDSSSPIPNTYWETEGGERNHNKLQVQCGRVSSKARRSSVVKKINAEEAFRLVKVACNAERDGQYGAAMRFFLESGEMLAQVGDEETDPHIKSLLHQKAMEVLSWTEGLADWIDSDYQGNMPLRMGKTVMTNVASRFQGNDLTHVSRTDSREFTTMAYTACSSKIVSHFTKDGYRLQCIQNGRRPQLMVVITMYNEDKVELNMTLRKVANNIQYIQERCLPGYEGDDAWKNILVVIVSDGRTKANPETLSFLRDVGIFDADAMNINSIGVDVNCHIFEYSVQFMNHKASNGLLGLGGQVSEKYPPMQVVFALKEHNAGKLNSHEWYFNAFAEQIQPEYTVLLDVGTLPTKTAFYRLLTAMEINPQIGGTCGEIAVDRPLPHLCNWIIAAQHFEYKISNLLDKSLESVFGYISVLPGAFSAYRYEAIRGAPLEAYFKSLTTPMIELGPFEGNMYLAEDRILCFELLAKKNSNWTMHYVKDAIARTDVPTSLISLIGQRRRWLNGSFFALVYTILNWGRVYTESSHSFTRKLFLGIQYTYMSANVFLSWFLLANYFLAVYYLLVVGLYYNTWAFIDTSKFNEDWKVTVVQSFVALYGLSFFVLLVAGLGNKPKHISKVYAVTAVFYALLMGFTTTLAMSYIYKRRSSYSQGDIVALIASFGTFYLAALLHGELHHIVLSTIQYFALLPSTINILNTYSFCNLHDLSWGTKGLESAEGHGPAQGASSGKYKDAISAQKAEELRKKKEDQVKDELEGNFQYFRSKLLIFWITSNLSVGYSIYKLDPKGESYLLVLVYVVALFNLFRFVGSVLFLIYNWRQSCFVLCCIRRKMEKLQAERKKKQRSRGRPAERLEITPSSNANLV